MLWNCQTVCPISHPTSSAWGSGFPPWSLVNGGERSVKAGHNSSVWLPFANIGVDIEKWHDLRIDACDYAWCWKEGRSFPLGVSPSLSIVDGGRWSSWACPHSQCCERDPGSTLWTVTSETHSNLTKTPLANPALEERNLEHTNVFNNLPTFTLIVITGCVSYLHPPYRHRHLKAD